MEWLVSASASAVLLIYTFLLLNYGLIVRALNGRSAPKPIQIWGDTELQGEPEEV